MKALCFGSMNIDYVYSLEHIVGPGETIFSTGRETFAGGKGLNQSVAMAKAGLPVWHAGICGTGGELLIDTLRENGVDTSLIRREDSPPGHTVIQVDARGQNCIIVYGGTNRRVTPEYIAEALSGFGEGDMVLLQIEPSGNTATAVEASAKESNTVACRVADPSVCTVIAGGREYARAVLPLFEFGRTINVALPRRK